MTIIQRISTHALREEGDNRSPFVPCSRMIFLPTPSARRATRRRVPHVHVLAISTHALREEGDATLLGSAACTINISTHALREEGDIAAASRTSMFSLFLPTPSARRATNTSSAYLPVPLFLPTPSARRATAPPSAQRLPHCHFYPRPPRGGRQRTFPSLPISPLFLPTPSARRATRRIDDHVCFL